MVISLIYNTAWLKSCYASSAISLPSCWRRPWLLAAAILPASYPMRHAPAMAYRPRIHPRMMPDTPHNCNRALPTTLEAATGTTGRKETYGLYLYPCPSPRPGNRRQPHTRHTGRHIPRKAQADRMVPFSRNPDQTSFCLFRMAYPSPPHNHIKTQEVCQVATFESVSYFVI
jgi:hypothetical protein